MRYIKAKSILQRTLDKNSMWFSIDYNMNLYKGCSHGCIYCDSRSSCYNIDNFDEVKIKENSLEILENELAKKRNIGVIEMGAMSDTYNPFEREYEITRGALRLIEKYKFGVSIATKSDLILRDIDLLKAISKNNSVIVKITITTSNDDLSKIIEPNVCVSSKRFEAVKKLTENGIFVGVLLMPVLPFIEDNNENIINIVRASYENKAKFIYAMFGVTLRENQRDYFFQKADKHFGGIKEKYIKTFGNSYICNSPDYKKLKYIFEKECEKYGILYKMKDIINAYKKTNIEQNLFEM